MASLREAIERLRTWMECRQFAGYDPFDLLNSPWLGGQWARRSLPGVALMQLGKRASGLTLRRWLGVPRSQNPKALGLALSAYCDLARCGHDVRRQAEEVKAALLRLRSPQETDLCWGYDWDYISLRGSRLPAFTGNCIATCFCAHGLLEMSEVFGDAEAGDWGSSAAGFVVSRLNRSYESDDAVCFSYTPHDRTVIYNSSALAGALLARVGTLRGNQAYLALARKAMVFLTQRQLPQGGWHYGQRRRQRWIDSFHSSYNICALLDYQRWTGDRSFEPAMLLGHRYYRTHFFLESGAPRYFHNQTYPIDIHACAQALLHFSAFREIDTEATEAAWKTFHWTMRNMGSADGSFYYQRHRFRTDRTPYMRWGQAWMLHALCRLLASANGRQDVPFEPCDGTAS